MSPLIEWLFEVSMISINNETLGVITKADRIDRGLEEDTMTLVKNQKLKLKKGFVMVKCRTYEELKNQLSLKVALENEKKFFKEHAYFR